MKKIVAIGGGKNGRLLQNGLKDPYETFEMDSEIVRLTGKEHPNFLFIGHSVPLEGQEFYFKTMKDIYENIFGCNCRDLKSDKLFDTDFVKELINWADIIYEGGGNTLDMIALWKKTNFDKILKQAFEEGKVMCGVSAGANCWFKECSSDSLQIKYGPNKPLIKVECLGLVDGLFVPHCDKQGRLENAKELLKESNEVGLFVSNCAAIEIVGNEYRIITSNGNKYNIEPYVMKSYWDNGKYLIEKIDNTQKFEPLSKLLSKNKKSNKNR